MGISHIYIFKSQFYCQNLWDGRYQLFRIDTDTMGTISIPSIDTVDTCELGFVKSRRDLEDGDCIFGKWHIYVVVDF